MNKYANVEMWITYSHFCTFALFHTMFAFDKFVDKMYTESEFKD